MKEKEIMQTSTGKNSDNGMRSHALMDLDSSVRHYIAGGVCNCKCLPDSIGFIVAGLWECRYGCHSWYYDSCKDVDNKDRAQWNRNGVISGSSGDIISLTGGGISGVSTGFGLIYAGS